MGLVGSGVRSFGLKELDFGFERFKFVHFALQKSAREGGFLGDAAGGQDVDVAEFVFRLAEVLHLDPAFVNQRPQAVVQAAGADAQLLGDLALRQVGVVLQHAQHPVVGVFLQLGSAGGHGVRMRCLQRFGQATAVGVSV